MQALEKDVLIVGGGVSGLSAAFYLIKGGVSPEKILLLEKNQRLGGTIFTEKINDCVLDAGPDSFVTTKPWALELCHELNLHGDLITPNAAARHLYFSSGRRLHAFPAGMMLGVPTDLKAFVFNPHLPFLMKARMLADLFVRPASQISSDVGDTSDCSVREFFGRHFGQRAVDLLVEPILAGIYAASASRLSLHTTFPQFVEMEKKYGSLICGMLAERRRREANGEPPVFYSLKGGMSDLIRALAAHIPASARKFGGDVVEVNRAADGRLQVRLADGEAIIAKHVILATPVSVTRGLFKNHPEMSRVFKGFSSTSTATVFLAFRRELLRSAVDGFGFVVPRLEARSILACTWISSKFPSRSPENVFLLRCFFGGAGHESSAGLDENKLCALAREEVLASMGIAEEPLFSRVYYWPNLSPQYDVGQAHIVGQMEESLRAMPGLQVIGNAYRGVGISDCVRLAKNASQAILNVLH